MTALLLSEKHVYGILDRSMFQQNLQIEYYCPQKKTKFLVERYSGNRFSARSMGFVSKNYKGHQFHPQINTSIKLLKQCGVLSCMPSILTVLVKLSG